MAQNGYKDSKRVSQHSNLRTFERKRDVSELPDLTIVIIKDLVLTVVFDHVVRDQLIIDNGGPNSFLILFDLLLGL